MTSHANRVRCVLIMAVRLAWWFVYHSSKVRADSSGASSWATGMRHLPKWPTEANELSNSKGNTRAK